MNIKKLKNISIGWLRWIELTEVPKKVKAESARRLMVCERCEYAKPNTFLEFINGGAENVKGMYCSECHCPCHQKSLVTEEECPKGFWKV